MHRCNSVGKTPGCSRSRRRPPRRSTPLLYRMCKAFCCMGSEALLTFPSCIGERTLPTAAAPVWRGPPIKSPHPLRSTPARPCLARSRHHEHARKDRRETPHAPPGPPSPVARRRRHCWQVQPPLRRSPHRTASARACPCGTPCRPLRRRWRGRKRTRPQLRTWALSRHVRGWQ